MRFSLPGIFSFEARPLPALVGPSGLPLFLLVILLSVPAAAQTALPRTMPSDHWALVTRLDYRVRIDGVYLGHADREIREVYRIGVHVPEGRLAEGSVLVLGATKKNGSPVAARLESGESVRFVLDGRGGVIDSVSVFPTLKGFPAFPDQPVGPGDSWEAPFDSVVFGPDGRRGVLRNYASYKYVREAPYQGRSALYIDVQWAIRYRSEDIELNSLLTRADGSHMVSLVIDAETGAPLMARDTLKETWYWSDSRVEEREGFALMFWEGVAPLDSVVIRRELEDRFPEEMEVNEIPEGLAVTLRNIRFQPDLAVLVPEDLPVLDDLAAALAAIPEGTILVRGHTADVGRPEEQYRLSEERAKLIADELTRRGIDPRRLIYEGVGADEPAAENGTEEGRRLNRRVELRILEF